MKLIIVINPLRMTVSEQIANEQAMDTGPTRSLPQVRRRSWLSLVTAMLGLPLVGGQNQMEVRQEAFKGGPLMVNKMEL
jgi:hypothetical protein